MMTYYNVGVCTYNINNHTYYVYLTYSRDPLVLPRRNDTARNLT